MFAIRMFVSSTWFDLQPERRAIEALLPRFRNAQFSGMEHFGSRADNTRSASLTEVDRCGLYIGIIGNRYGSGITEAEYRRAQQRQLPCLIYFKEADATSPQHDGDDHRRLHTFKTELRTRHTVSTFSTPSDLAAKLAADLHNWLFDKYLVQGLNAVGAPFAESVQNFLTEYTGTFERPVPFGGRDKDVAWLTAWLDGNGPRHAVVAAPAGRGKSALLVHWSRTLMQREDLAVVFFPISIRFNTNLALTVFPALAARMAALHNESLQAPPDATTELWRSLVANYLGRPLPDGRRLLVIVDGLDEAADWEAGPDLFPYTLAHGTRIVVSARYLADVDESGWLRRLGWDEPGRAAAMSLDPLTHRGVADVLSRLGLDVGALSVNVDLVAELHRLSEGDPLLVRLYVTALQADIGTASRLEADDLQSIKPGLDGYFTRWWEDQRRLWGPQTPLREPAVQALLNLLACALGPLEQKDVLQLSPKESSLSAWTLDDAVRPLGRFVVGDGVTQGYAFSHPRLGSYFYEKLQKAGQARRQELGFVEWGQQTLSALRSHKLEPTHAPTYLVRYLRPHIERMGGGVKDMLDLVSSEWLGAWSVLDKGSFAGFLSDVRHVWQLAEQADLGAARRGEPAPFIDVELRCALCVSSVISIAQDIPGALLVALVRQEVWTPVQGLAYASNIPDVGLRVATLLELSKIVPEAHRDSLLGAALSAARAAPRGMVRDSLLERVAESLSDPLAAVRHIDAEDRRLEQLRVALRRSGPLHQIDVLIKAIPAIQQLTDVHAKLELMSGLIRRLPEPHCTRLEETLIAVWEETVTGASALPNVLSFLRPVPDQIASRALALAMAVPEPIDRAALFASLAYHGEGWLVERAATR